MDKKMLIAAMVFISLFVVLSGCTDLYKVLQTYVPTVTPAPSTLVPIGQNVPASNVKGVTITGQGNTITISGSGPYNVESHQDYIALNQGKAEFHIDLKGSGFGFTSSMDYTNPYTNSMEYLTVYEFTSGDRQYQSTHEIDVPYTTRYCLMVNWGGDWTVRITE